MFYVYIVKSLKTGIYYKGLTNNLDKRLKQHLSGKSPSTRHRLPLKLIHVEICETRQRARIIEKFFKSGYGREIIKEIDINVRVAKLAYAQGLGPCILNKDVRVQLPPLTQNKFYKSPLGSTSLTFFRATTYNLLHA